MVHFSSLLIRDKPRLPSTNRLTTIVEAAQTPRRRRGEWRRNNRKDFVDRRVSQRLERDSLLLGAALGCSEISHLDLPQRSLVAGVNGILKLSHSNFVLPQLLLCTFNGVKLLLPGVCL